MYPSLRHRLFVAALLALVLSVVSNFALAACGQSYAETALVKNTGKKGDKQLINPWGLAYGPSDPFWLSDEGSGLSTLYTGAGAKQSLVVTIPTASGTGVGSPTGIVYNGHRNSKSTAGRRRSSSTPSTVRSAAGRTLIRTTL